MTAGQHRPNVSFRNSTGDLNHFAMGQDDSMEYTNVNATAAEFGEQMGMNPFGLDGFTPANDPSASSSTLSHTVSPHDLLLDNFDSPAQPNSSTFTDMTTPSLYDSPNDPDSFGTSPMFHEHDATPGHGWYPLFGDVANDSPVEQALELTSSADSFNKAVDMTRSSSNFSVESRPESQLHRLSVSSGIQKNRRTGKTLPPIEVDENDTRAAKRAKNTLAARKSRQKKRDVEEGLRADLQAMTAQRDRWMHIAIQHGAAPPDT